PQAIKEPIAQRLGRRCSAHVIRQMDVLGSAVNHPCEEAEWVHGGGRHIEPFRIPDLALAEYPADKTGGLHELSVDLYKAPGPHRSPVAERPMRKERTEHDDGQ